MLRVGREADYWLAVSPAILVISLGMAGAVAPLLPQSSDSVDARHTGSASGINSAIARTGGLLGTALLGGVLGATGADLIVKSHTAWIACALICVAAAGCSFRLVSIDSAHVDSPP